METEGRVRRPGGDRWSRREIVLLGVILAVAFGIRAWLVPHRWINPDEGAHLMDGVLLLEGLVPGVDYSARQVLYVHLTALAVRVGGTDLFVLRYFPLVTTVAAGAVIHLIGRRLFGWRAGLTAAGLFLLLPFVGFMTVHTKTEPLAILGAAGAVYFLVRAQLHDGRRFVLLTLSGACAGAAFYVRASAVAVLGVLLLAAVAERRVAWRDRGRSVAAVLLGVGLVSAAVTAYYLRVLPLGEALTLEAATPFHFLAEQGVGVLSALGASEGGNGATFGQSDELGQETTLRNLAVVARVTLVVIAASAVALAAAAGERLAAAGEGATRRLRDGLYRHGVPAAWAAVYVLAYAFWTVRRGFFPAYALEATAAASLLAGAGAAWCWRRLPGNRSPGIHLAALAVAAGVLAAVHVLAGTRQISRPLYFFVTLATLAVFYLPARPLRLSPTGRRWAAAGAALAVLAGVAVAVGPGLRPVLAGLLYLATAAGGLAVVLWARTGGFLVRPAAAAAFAAYTLIVSSAFLTLSESALHLDAGYHAVWSPETLERTSGVLRRTTDPGATVASGAVIWEFQTDRAPFARLSHPLIIRGGGPEEEVRALRRELAASPPDVVVLDGYTEQTYFDALPEMEELVRERYRLVAVVPGSRFPVEVHVRDANAEAAARDGGARLPRPPPLRPARQPDARRAEAARMSWSSSIATELE